MRNNPLAYNISKWSQATQCLSNNSVMLHISVSDVDYQHHLVGTIIQVHHDKLGVLFSALVDAKGSMLTEASDGQYHEFTTDDVLHELYKFGFIISFNKQKNLSGAQLEYLMTLRDLGFDKLRTIEVIDKPNNKVTTNIVVFNVYKNPNWLVQQYSPSIEEFKNSLADGSAINITEISKTKLFEWDWLTFVANINDILIDNED